MNSIRYRWSAALAVAIVAVSYCTSQGDSGDSQLTDLSQLLTASQDVTGDFAQDDYASHIGEAHSPGLAPLPAREAELAEMQAISEATSTGTITASGTEDCPGGGTITYSFTANLTLTAYTDPFNKEGTIDSAVRSLEFEGCSPHPGLTINSGTMTFTQTGTSTISFAQSGDTVTVTSTDKVFTVEGSMNGTHRPPPPGSKPPEGAPEGAGPPPGPPPGASGGSEITDDLAISIEVTESEKVASLTVSGSSVEDLQPVSVKGSINGTVTHSTPMGEQVENIDQDFDKTF